MGIILKKGPEANRNSISLATGEVIFTTDTRRLYIGSGSSSNGFEITFNQLTASFITASQITASVVKANSFIGTASYAGTASYIVGSIESASYADYAPTASYLSGSGFRTTAIGDVLSTDATTNTWQGLQSNTGSGIFVQRSSTARFGLLSAAPVGSGNGSFTAYISSGSINSIQPTQAGHFASFQMATWGGSSWTVPARMYIAAGGDHTETSRPTDIYFQTTPSGSTTLSTRMKVNGTGVQVTGSLSATTSIGVNASMVFSKKMVAINTSNYATCLTVNMGDDASAYLKVSLHGAWTGGGSAVYVGEFFLQKEVVDGRHPGGIIQQINNNATGEILANISAADPSAGNQDIDIQFWASSSAAPVGNFLMLYELRGSYNSVN